MKRVLFLLGRYLPQASANGICVEKIIEQLIIDGYEVICIVYKDQHEIKSKYGEKVIRVDRGIVHNIFYKYENRNTKMSKIITKGYGVFQNIKHALCFYNTPWIDPIFTYKVYKKVNKICKDTHIDYIIPIYMPISSMIVAERIKRNFPDIQYIPYFLDSLSGGILPRYISREFSLNKRLNWEEKLLFNADKIICMNSSKEHHEKYNSNKAFFSKIYFLDIPLLSKNKELAHDNIKKNEINVVFGGLLNYPLRNIPYIIEVFEKMNRQDINLIFIGNTNRKDIFEKAKRSSKMKIQYFEYMEHDKLEKYLEEADFLLNMGVKTPSAISGKIFEYMSYSKPIISTFSIDDEACIPYLEKYPRALLIDERITDIDSQAQKLNSFIEQCKFEKIDKESIVNNFYMNTPKAFIDVLQYKK